MKYVVRNPKTNEVVATYESRNGRWEVGEPGPPYLAHDLRSRAPTLIDAVLEEQRRKGRIVSQEP